MSVTVTYSYYIGSNTAPTTRKIRSNTMNKHKVYQLRQRHGLDKAAFARIVYTTLRTVRRWESGDTPVCPARFELAAMKLEDVIALEQVGAAQ